MKTITYTQTLLRAHLPKPKTDPRVKTIQKKKKQSVCVSEAVALPWLTIIYDECKDSWIVAFKFNVNT